jgi:hypothetical protein
VRPFDDRTTQLDELRIVMRSEGPQGFVSIADGNTEHHRLYVQPQDLRAMFSATGGLAIWGRGTNRVIEACLAHGIAPPEFADNAGVVTVTCKVDVVPDAMQGPSRDQVGPK